MKLRKVGVGLMALVGSMFALTAQATDYYWKGGVSVNWSDASNWCTDAACTKQATDYPKKSGDYARFNADTTANITLTENISISGADFSAANLTLSFASDDAVTLSLSNGNGYTTVGANVHLSFDGVSVNRSGGWTLGAESTLVAKNGSCTLLGLTIPGDGSATFENETISFGNGALKLLAGSAKCTLSASTLTTTSSYSPEAGSTLELLDGSTMSAGASSVNCACFFTLKGKSKATFNGQYTGGSGATVTIDDSTIVWNGYAYLNAGTGCEHYILKGNNPKIISQSAYFRTINNVGAGMNFDFEVPVGGFAEPPIQDYNAWGAVWLSSSSGNTKGFVNVLEDSPAAKSTEYITDCPLVYSPYGIYRDIVGRDTAITRFASYDGKTAAKDNSSAKCLYVTLGSGSPAPKPAVEYSTGVSGRARATVSRRTFTVASDVNALSTVHTTRARLLVGESSGTLAEVDTKDITATGTFSFTWSAPEGKLNNKYFFQIVLETLDGEAVVYSESSPVSNNTTQDTTIYTWQAVDGEWDGVWSDRAHWATDTGDDRFDYPQTSSCQIEFPADQAVTITVDQSLNVGKMKLNKNGIDVTLVNAVEDKTQNKMTGIINCDGTYDCSITFKYLEFRNTDNTFPGSGKKIRFENGYFWTYGYYQGKGTTELYLKDSTCYIGSYVTISSDGVTPTRTVTLDNSQMTVVGNFAASYYKYGKILFKGQNPKLYLSSADKTIFSELDGVDASFEFEIPEGGFTEPPISCVATDTKKAFNDTKALPAFNFVILETSPALLTAGDSTYPLMTWAPGITTGRVNFDGVVSATDTFLYGNMNAEGYDWQPVATSTLSNPTAIGVTIHGLTSTDIVTVQGNPGDYGVASPAYGQTTGHTAGETATYSVPEPIFEKEGVNYAVSGYVVSNVLADLSHEFAYEGKGSSFEYTHPATATVVTWLWGRSFALTVNAGEGGTVSPTSKICAEGEVVEVMATPNKDCAFSKWTGDTDGIADVTKATISVTMDRARTLTANFGKSVSVSTVEDLTTALAAANDNDVIVLEAGEYQLTSAFEIAKAITVRGATGNPDDVIVYGGKKLTKKVGFSTFILSNKGAVLKDLTVSHGYGDTYGVHLGTGAKVTAGTIQNCVFRECDSSGKWANSHLYITGSDSVISHCVITNNAFTRQTDTGGDDGLFLHVVDGAFAHDILVVGNTAKNDNTGSIVLCGANATMANVTVVKNTIAGVASIGGIKAAASTAKVLNCVIAGNTTTAGTSSYATWAGTASCFQRCVSDAYAPNDSCYAGSELGLVNLAAGDFHLTAASKAVNFGVDYEGMAEKDLDGNVRKQGVAIDAGCYEFDLSKFGVGFVADKTSGFAPLSVTFTPTLTGTSEGDEIELSWDFNGDGTWDMIVQNADPVTTEYNAGSYTVILKAVNKATQKEATSEMKNMLTVGAKTLYVKLGNEECAAYPYDSEATAAADVQTAIDAALVGAEVRIFDGDYQLTKAITLDKEITVTSVSGNKDAVILRGGRQQKNSPKFHVIEINAGVGALVHSLTLADGVTSGNSEDESGCVYIATKGGTVSNCVITGGAAYYKTAKAGGVFASGANAFVTHCILSNNFACGGYSDGASPQGAAIALFSGARCEHSLITLNRMGNSVGGGVGPSQNTVHVGADSYLRFCTIVSNAAYCVAGVNVAGANSHVEYCVIAGNHSMHRDEITFGQQNVGIDNATADQVNRWHVWGAIGDYNAGSTVAERDAKVCANELTKATAAVAAAFKTCSGDTVKINDACKQVQAEDIFVNYERGILRIPYGTAISDLVAPAELTGAGIAMPSVDVMGKRRLRGEKYDIGAIECQMVDGFMLLVK